jgi:hypothetical protein
MKPLDLNLRPEDFHGGSPQVRRWSALGESVSGFALKTRSKLLI